MGRTTVFGVLIEKPVRLVVKSLRNKTDGGEISLDVHFTDYQRIQDPLQVEWKENIKELKHFKQSEVNLETEFEDGDSFLDYLYDNVLGWDNGDIIPGHHIIHSLDVGDHIITPNNSWGFYYEGMPLSTLEDFIQTIKRLKEQGICEGTIVIRDI